MNEYKFDILGKAMGKERPRATVIGNHARVYTPKKSQNYEGRVASAFQAKYPDAKPFTGAVTVMIMVCVGLNKADYKKDGTLTKSGKRKVQGLERPTKKPDLDNVAKAILDGLNGIAFVDDSQIIALTVMKTYDERERAGVTITRLGGDL